MAPLLEVQNLKKYFKTKAGPLHAVDDVTFTLEKGKTLGVVGESGCGKSVKVFHSCSLFSALQVRL